MTKKEKVVLLLSILGISLMGIAYTIMTLMYYYIANTNLNGNYAMFFLLIFIVLFFLAMSGCGLVLSIINTSMMLKKYFPKENKKRYILMLIINIITMIGGVLFLLIMSLFASGKIF